MLKKEFSNCSMSIDEKGIMTIKLDMNKNVGKSESQKSINIGTTHGNSKFAFNDKIVNLGLNCYYKNPDYVVTEKDKAKYKEIYSK